jgi:hypothetical protein
VQVAQGLQRTDQHRGAYSGIVAHKIQEIVDAVAQIHVEVARRPEHSRVPSRHTPVCVTGRVVVRQIRLHFDQAPSAYALPPEYLAHQLRCDEV